MDEIDVKTDVGHWFSLNSIQKRREIAECVLEQMIAEGRDPASINIRPL